MIYNFDELFFQILGMARFSHPQRQENNPGRPFASISFRYSGEAYFRIGDKEFVSSPGTIMFLPANTAYTVDYFTSGESMVVHLVNCNYSDFENYVPNNSEYLFSKFQELEVDWNKFHNSLRAKSIIYSILSYMQEDSLVSADRAFAACLSYIQNNFTASDMNISNICRKFNISSSSLYRCFSAQFGVPPKQYILKLRLNYAVNLLAQEGMSVKSAAEASGFPDEKYFSRIFKSHYGKNPSEFKIAKQERAFSI